MILLNMANVSRFESVCNAFFARLYETSFERRFSRYKRVSLQPIKSAFQ